MTGAGPTTEPLRARAEATQRLAQSLGAEARGGPVVLQPTDVQGVAAAVSAARALEPLARETGLDRELADLVEAAHTLHYELSNRLRDAEDLSVGTDVIPLIDAMGQAAERLASAAAA